MSGAVVTSEREAETVGDRLAAAAREVVDLRAALDAAIEARDELIVRSVEAGYTNRDTARWARLSEARVIAVLARS